jgi:UDP-glucuronate decarboxylase
LEGRAIDVNGDGTAFRSYMYASHLAEWLWTILLKGKTGPVYNVGSDQAISIKALAQLISQCFAPASEDRVLKKETIGQLIERYIPDIQLAKRELALQVFTSLEDAIEKTVEWNYQQGRRV